MKKEEPNPNTVADVYPYWRATREKKTGDGEKKPYEPRPAKYRENYEDKGIKVFKPEFNVTFGDLTSSSGTASTTEEAKAKDDKPEEKAGDSKPKEKGGSSDSEDSTSKDKKKDDTSKTSSDADQSNKEKTPAKATASVETF